MTDPTAYTERNRRAWNEIAGIRRAMWQPAAFFAEGGSVLDPRVLATGGDVHGRTLLHLQCATGEETLSWAVAGATATGVDISEAQIELARQKAVDAALQVRFVAADIYILPDDLQSSTFDLVYTGGGAIVWLPDLELWGRAIARALKPGGLFILFEEHPVASCLMVENGELKIESDYFGRAEPQYGQGWRHFAGGEHAVETKVEFAWPLGDVVTALAGAGLHIESLEEFPSQEGWRFGDQLDAVRRLPGQYLLLARKEAEFRTSSTVIPSMHPGS